MNFCAQNEILLLRFWRENSNKIFLKDLPRIDLPTTVSFNFSQKQGIFRRFSSEPVQSVFHHPEFGSFDLDDINNTSGTEIQSRNGQFSFAPRNMLALAKIDEKCKETKDDFDVHNVQCIKKD